jgi:dTDP-4-amino-4,6-dideoxygalactose transaminase
MADKMRIPLFDLKLPPESIRQVRDVLASGWLNTGPKAAEFEKSIAAMVGVRYAVALNSATAGLQLTLEALGCGPGREVVTTPFTFAATSAAIIRAGAMPVFADIDPATLTIDPDEVARKITSRTVCVLPVDVAGHPADYPELGDICDRKHIPLVADAAHSLGAAVGRYSVDRLVDAAVHSFQATKNLTTADGGMVVTRHKIIAERVRLLSQHAMTANAYQRSKSGKWAYDVLAPGLKANLTDVHAAIGLGQLAGFEKNQLRREKIAARYCRNLGDLSDFVVMPVVRDGYRHAWHLFIVRLHLSRLRIRRARFIELMADAGIECGVHYRPLFEMSFYREIGFTRQYFPNAAYAGERVVSLPLYPGLTTSQVDHGCEAVRRIILRFRR